EEAWSEQAALGVAWRGRSVNEQESGASSPFGLAPRVSEVVGYSGLLSRSGLWQFGIWRRCRSSRICTCLACRKFHGGPGKAIAEEGAGPEHGVNQAEFRGPLQGGTRRRLRRCAGPHHS